MDGRHRQWQLPAHSFVRTGRAGPYYDYNAVLNTSYYAPVGKSTPYDIERWDNPATTQLLNTIAKTDNLTVQKQAVYGLEKFMVNDIPVIPFDYNGFQAVWSSQHFTGFPSQSDPYTWPMSAQKRDRYIASTPAHVVPEPADDDIPRSHGRG